MEKTVEDSRGRCTTLWSCRDFTGPQPTIYSKPKGFQNNVTSEEKCFKLNLETQLVSGENFILFGATEKGKYSLFGCRCFLFCIFQDCKKCPTHDKTSICTRFFFKK